MASGGMLPKHDKGVRGLQVLPARAVQMNTSCIDRQHPQRPGGTVPIVPQRQSARGMTNTWWHSSDLVIGIFPDCYGPPQPDWPP
jgi:hypothetical protein